MNMDKKLYEKGLEKFPTSWIIGQNLFLTFYFAMAFIGMYPLQIYRIPIVSLLFAIYIILMLVFVLRKHLCTNCYYYGKSCHVGWGKLSACLFKQKSGNYELGGKLANVTWILVATILPIIGIGAVVIWKWVSLYYTLLFIVFIVMSGLNFAIQKKSCEKCKMRFICPGSLAKEL
jgi:hypothetical protein